MGFPVIIIIGAVANLGSGSFFEIMLWIGIIWLFLSFLPILIRKVKHGRK